MRLGPGGYHSTHRQLSRFGNSTGKPDAKVELGRLERCTAHRSRPNAARNSQAPGMSASLQKADIRKSDVMEIGCPLCSQERTTSASPTSSKKHRYRKSQSDAQIMADGQSSFIGGAGSRGSGLSGFGAGCQGFRRHDGNRKHELRSLAVDERASGRGNRLDLRLLDRTQLRCCCKRSSTVGNRHGRDSGRSQEDMCAVTVSGLGERRLDQLP